MTKVSPICNHSSCPLLLCLHHNTAWCAQNECIQGWLCQPVCPSVCLHDSTGEPLDGFGWHFVWELHHWRLPKLILFNFLKLVIPTGQLHKLLRWEQHKRHLIQVHTMTYDNRFMKNIQLWYSNYMHSVKHGSCMK